MVKKVVSKKRAVKKTTHKKQADLYVQEMLIWVRQMQARLKSCEISIKVCDKQIANYRELRKLGQAQARIIKQSILDGKKQLAFYLTRKSKKG